MNLTTPPEIADGGYWYKLAIVPDPIEGGQTPGDIPGQGWCAWYADGAVFVRTPEPVSRIVTLPGVVQISVGKPYGRIGGS
jgi:hypothetical protein